MSMSGTWFASAYSAQLAYVWGPLAGRVRRRDAVEQQLNMHALAVIHPHLPDVLHTLPCLCLYPAGAVLGLLVVLGLGGAAAAVLRWRESNARNKA
jgi:hypothetical protein